MYKVQQESTNLAGTVTAYVIRNDADNSIVGYVMIRTRKNRPSKWSYFNEAGALLYPRTHERQINGMANAVRYFVNRNDRV